MNTEPRGIEFRPSASTRWMTCTASVQATADYPPDPGSVYADEGSVAHLVLEHSKPGEAHKFLGHIFPEYPHVHPVDQEMVDMVERCHDYISRVSPPARRMFEETEMALELDLQLPERRIIKGTGDVVTYELDNILHIFDLKYGKGKFVPADTPQTKLYALGAMQYVQRHGFAPRQVYAHILQPRYKDAEPFRFRAYQPEELAAEFAAEVRQAVAEALSPNRRFAPSTEACQWCPLKATCRARAEESVKAVAPAFGLQGFGRESIKNEQLLKPAQLTAEELAWLLNQASNLRGMLSDAESYVSAALERDPNAVPGWKLVEGRRSRKWRSDEEAQTALAAAGLDPDEYMVTSVISPAQAEKQLGNRTYRETVDSCVEYTRGRPMLAPASDRRPSLGAVSQSFGIE